MQLPNPKNINYNPATEAAPQIESCNELIGKMNSLLSSVATSLPPLPINEIDKGRVISVMDALARDRDALTRLLNMFRSEINNTNETDIELEVPISLYATITQFNSKLELYASNFASHMTSLTSIDSIAKIIA